MSSTSTKTTNNSSAPTNKIISQHSTTTNRFHSLTTFITFSKIYSFTVEKFLRLLRVIITLINAFPKFSFLKRIESYLWYRARVHYAKVRNIPPPISCELGIEHIETPVEGGAIRLQGTLFLPLTASRENPVSTILIRTPYDRFSPMLGLGLARIFAERGYGCLIQDTRGRFGSGGDFIPVAKEVADGGATVDFIRQQPWSNGRVGAWGVSYLAMCAYATCGGSDATRCQAVAPVMGASRIFPILYHDGHTLALDLIIRWLWIVLDIMHRNPITALFKLATMDHQLKSALHSVKPIINRDRDLLGKDMSFFKDCCMANNPEHEFWADKDKLCDLTSPKHNPALNIVAGWHDFFCAQSFADFENASKFKTDAPLKMIVGPWSHWDMRYFGIGISSALELFDQVLKKGHHDDESLVLLHQANNYNNNGQQLRPTTINVFVMHSEEIIPGGLWMEFDHWPPRESKIQKLLLGSGERLQSFDIQMAFGGGADFTEHIFDPHHPTPSVGGPSFDPLNSGRKEQSQLESRPDVLVFTTPVLDQDVFCVGKIMFELYFWADNLDTDIFIKLCGVDRNGHSFNIVEKFHRLTEQDTNQVVDVKTGCFRLMIDLGNVAVCFPKGTRARCQISGGSHPVYLRHHSTGEHPALSELTDELKCVKRRVFHNRQFPSRIHLPLLG